MDESLSIPALGLDVKRRPGEYAASHSGAAMNDEAFNLSLRKFLKTFGVTAQREIERAVQAAIDSGTLSGPQSLTARATIRIDAVGLNETVEGQIVIA
jgi:hypothetical protein